jgi:hypothetical protein
MTTEPPVPEAWQRVLVDRIDDIAEEIYSVVEESVTDMLALKPPATISAECERAAKAVLNAIAATCDALAALANPSVLLGAWERLGKVWWDESEEAWRVTLSQPLGPAGRGVAVPEVTGADGHVSIVEHLRDEHGTGSVDGLTDRRQAALHRRLHGLEGAVHSD